MPKTVLLFGIFPPPVVGMAIVNQKLADALAVEGFRVSIINESPFFLGGRIIRLSRLIRFWSAWKKLLFSNEADNIVYIALSGRWGQLYDLVTALIARIKRYPIVVHHHSFAYLYNRNLLSSILFMILGEKTTHIALCKTAQELLWAQYHISNILLLSNLVFFPSHPSVHSISKPVNLGFIGTVTIEKGAHIVIDLAYAIKAENLPYKITIAGPCYDDRLKARIEEAQRNGVLEWKGLITGYEKEVFWQSIDALIFPSSYLDESEPLVIWEAMAAGVPVLTCRRGCIKEQLGMTGYLFDHVNFTESVISILKLWHNNPTLYQKEVSKVRKQYLQAREEAVQQWKNFVCMMEGIVRL